MSSSGGRKNQSEDYQNYQKNYKNTEKKLSRHSTKQSSQSTNILSQKSEHSLEWKLEWWKNLDKESKKTIIESIINQFIEEAKKNRAEATRKFLLWLKSDDGAIIFPWLFKEEYREIMVDIAYYIILGTSKGILNWINVFGR